MPSKSSFETLDEYYSTVFHEMTHSTGHKTRLDRKLGSSFGKHEYSKEELVAELGASLLLAHCNISNDTTNKNSLNYLKAWLSHIDEMKSTDLISAFQQSQKAIDFIIEKTIGIKENVDELVS